MADQQITPPASGSWAKRQPAVTGTIVGAPPTLEWIGVEQLTVDPAYQRDTGSYRSRTIISGMVRAWDWRLCQPLAVVRREGGVLAVVDGQHRLLGAKARGDIAHLPCVVTNQPSIAAEADLFVALNTRRRALTQHEIFSASLAAGDANSKRAEELAHAAGLSFVHHNSTDRWLPGQIHCGPMLSKSIRIHGEAVVRNALVAMAEAHAGQRLTSSATLLKALFIVYSEDAGRAGFDPDLFIAGLGSVPHGEWLDELARVKREQPGLSRMDALATAMIEAMDYARRDAAEAA